MLDFEKEQTANPKRQHPYGHLYRQNDILLTAGFKRTEHILVWEKDGVCYGREVALQQAWQKLRFTRRFTT